MSNPTYRAGPDGLASTPTSYKLEQFVITSNNTKHDGEDEYVWDFKESVADFTIIESIYSPHLEIMIRIGDSNNLMEKLRLSGNESIIFKVMRESQSRGKESLTVLARVAELYGYNRSQPGMQTYTLKATSHHLYTNQTKILKRSFSGAIPEIVGKILSSDLEIEDTDINTSSKNVIKGIFPSLRPIQAINWLMNNAYDDGTPHFFYETKDSVLHFNSYKQLIEQDLYDTYVYKPFISSEQNTEEGYEEERTKIQSFRDAYTTSPYVSIGKGAYASTIHTVDIAKKEYKKETFDYQRNNLYKLNDHKPFALTDRTLPVNELSESKNYFVSQNSMAFPSHGNYYSPAGIDTNKSYAYIENINYQTHQIGIAGDFNLHVGAKIEIEIQRGEQDPDGANINKFHSGTYIITQIVNEFKEQFWQYLTIKKDSSRINLDA